MVNLHPEWQTPGPQASILIRFHRNHQGAQSPLWTDGAQHEAWCPSQLTQVSLLTQDGQSSAYVAVLGRHVDSGRDAVKILFTSSCGYVPFNFGGAGDHLNSFFYSILLGLKKCLLCSV